MKTTADYLDAIKERHRLPSDYAAAKLLGVTRSAASKYRHGLSAFDDDVCGRAAELLDCDPEEVLIAAQIERAKDDNTRAVWARLAKKCGYAAGIVAMTAGLSGAPAPAQASILSSPAVCIM